MSWKKFGGTHQTEKLTNLNVRGLVADTFSLRQSYLGLLDISGMVNMGEDLKLYGNANILTNVLVHGNITANQEMNILGNLSVKDSIYVNKIYLKDQIVLNNQAISGFLYMGNDGDVPYLYGTVNGLGFNTSTPSSTMDIVGDRPETIKIYTTSGINTNILAQNVNHRGMNITSTDQSTTLKIYNDQPMFDPLGNPAGGYDARIQYRLGGVLEIDTDRDTRIMSHLSLYNTIVDSEPYLYNVYENPAIISGNTITVSTVDPTASTFINIGYPVNGTAGLGEDGLVTGGSIGAGAFPGDPSRSFLTLGLTNGVGTYSPTQNIVSGTNTAKLRSTIGINTHAPLYDEYMMDINGPIRIVNGEVSDVFHSPFKILATSFSDMFGVAVGTSLGASANGVTYSHFVLVTRDGGQTWSESPIVDPELNYTSVSFLAAFAYDASHAIIVGDSGYVFYTGNSGASWHKLIGGLTSDFNSRVTATAVTVIDHGGQPDMQRVFISYNSTVVNGSVSVEVLYFDINMASVFSSGQDYTIAPYPALMTNTLAHIYAMGQSWNLNDGLLIAGEGGVYSFFSNSLILGTSGYTYSSIDVYSYALPGNVTRFTDFVLAVGPGIITTISNHIVVLGKQHTFPSSYLFTGVSIKDENNAIAVGYDTITKKSILYYTNDGSQTWSTIPQSILNTSGNGAILYQYPLTSVAMSDDNSFLFTSWDSVNKMAKLFYCYLPNLLNHANNGVLDVCGNVAISGGIWIQDDVVVDGDETVNGSVYASHVDARPLDTVLNIGTSVQSKTINIGNPDNNNLYGASEAAIGHGVISNTVRIGGENDYIIIGGQAQQVTISNMTINNKILTLNSISGTALSSSEYPSSAGAGFIVDDVRSGHDNGYLTISDDFDGFVMKPTLANSNRVKIDVNHLKTTDTNITNGLVVFRRAKASEIDCDFVVEAGTVIDISNIVVNSSCEKQDLQTIASPFLFTNTVGIKGTVDVSGIVTLENNSEATGLSTGALQVTQGGASIAKQLYVGGRTSYFYGNISIGQGAYSSGNYPQYGTPATDWGTGALLVYGGASVSGNTYVSGNIYGGYDASLNRHLKVGGNARVYGNLHLNGDASMNSHLYVALDASLNGNLWTYGNSTVNGNLIVTRDASLNGNLWTYGNSTVSGNLIVTRDASLNGNLWTYGNSTVNGNLIVTRDASLNGNLWTYGNSTVNGNLIVVRDASLNGNLWTYGNSTVNGNLIVVRDASLNGNLWTYGNSTVNGNLIVTRDASLNGNLWTYGNSTVNGNLIVTRDASLNGNLWTYGNSTVNGNLIVTRDASLNGNLWTYGNSTVNGNLIVTRDASLNGNLFINKNMNTSIVKGNGFVTYSSSYPFASGVNDHLYLRVDSNYAYLDSGGGNPFLIRGSLTGSTGDIGLQTYGNIIVAQKNSTSANVMIGKDTITGYNLDVSGTVNATSYNASSDYRIKDNVVSLNGTYVVDNLRPVEYFNKSLKRQDVGLIAHELQEIYPFLVTGDKDAEHYQSINYTGLIGILIREIQELKKRVAVLEGEK